MIELLSAIQTEFDTSSVLAERYPNGCYLSLAPNGTAKPLCVLTMVSAVPEFNTGNRALTKVVFQLSVFASSADPSGFTNAVEDIATIKTVFDFAPLSLASQQCVLVQRRNEGIIREDEATWHLFVEYEAWIGETLGATQS